MAVDDMRQFIEALKKTGDVVCVDEEVDWDLEASSITARSLETQGPAIFFERLKDYPEGGRILGGVLGTWRRIAIAMGLDPTMPLRELHEEYAQRMEKPIKPVVVKTGPCKENKMLGDEVDLFKFPAPVIHDGDGGRYIGTWHIVVTKEPESDWINWGMYRLMIHNRRTLACFMNWGSHLATIFREHYEPVGKAMPVAMVLGPGPLSAMIAGTAVRYGLSEVDYAGGLCRQPIELVKCETNDLLVPADAEIVLEGEILPNVKIPEGPFGEFPGYRTQAITVQPAWRINAITYRTNPIIGMTPEGIGPGGRVGASLSNAVNSKVALLKRGIPVADVSIPLEMEGLGVVISIKQHEANLVDRIAEVLCKRRAHVPKIFLVDDDIDVFDMREVIHAFIDRCHPVRGTHIIEGKGAFMLVPYFDRVDREKLRTRGDSVSIIYDCTWPVGWSRERDIPVRMSFKTSFPQAIQQRVLDKWEKRWLK